MPKLVLIIHNVRSAHNVGSLLRTAEGLGIDKVFMTGITPYPLHDRDDRLPHIGGKVHRRIAKTALGAEDMVEWERSDDVVRLAKELKHEGFLVAALEQTADAVDMPAFRSNRDLALIAGNEVDGVDQAVLALADIKLTIPMNGRKESFNVAVAAAMALYHLKFKV